MEFLQWRKEIEGLRWGEKRDQSTESLARQAAVSLERNPALPPGATIHKRGAGP